MYLVLVTGGTFNNTPIALFDVNTNAQSSGLLPNRIGCRYGLYLHGIGHIPM